MALASTGKVLQQTLKGVSLNSSVAKLSTVTDATFQTAPYKLYKLDSGPSTDVTCTRDDALALYEKMQSIRRMETTASNMYKDKQIRGFCHLYSGQEACVVGMKAGLAADDSVITAYRCHGWAHVMGVPVQEILSELAGRVSGNVFGKGGSMHMYAKQFYGGNGIVGAQVPIGAGIALAHKYRNEKSVCVALYGDGAANQGQVFEAYNMAKLWNLPCIFVCENNGFGMGTAVNRAAASTDYYSRGDYIPGIYVDAMDVLAVREGTRWAAEYSRSGNGPIILDMATYRYYGHSMSDPGTSYRTRDEIQEVRKTRDPITGFKDKIISANLVGEDEIKKIDIDCRKMVDDALQSALQQPYPPVELLYTDVYADTDPKEYPVRTAVPQEDLVVPFAKSIDCLKSKGIPLPHTAQSIVND